MDRTVQPAQRSIPFNTPIVGNPWHNRLIVWKDPTTWHEPLSSWLMPMVAPRRKLRLKQRKSLDLCWDDPEWMERLDGALTDPIEEVVEKLAEDLGSATLETYHGCRVHDAGVFHRDGLRINDPEKLEAEVQRMVRDEPALHRFSDTVESMIAEFDARDRDVGRIWLCADDRPQLDRIGHYALYGSEWILCVFDTSARPALREIGVPTILKIHIPFERMRTVFRKAFAEKLLQEWTRTTINPTGWTPKIDFSISLLENVPASMVVGHMHPAVLKDPFSGYALRRSSREDCPHCSSDRITASSASGDDAAIVESPMPKSSEGGHGGILCV